MPTFFVNFLSFFCHFLSFNYMHLCLCIKSMHSKSNILNAIKNEYKLNINAFINALLLLPIAITFYASIRSKKMHLVAFDNEYFFFRVSSLKFCAKLNLPLRIIKKVSG